MDMKSSNQGLFLSIPLKKWGSSPSTGVKIMENRIEKYVKNQLEYLDGFFTGRSSIKDSGSPVSDTTSAPVDIFADFACDQLIFSKDKSNTDNYGFYCQLLNGPCVQTKCSKFKQV